MQTPGQEIFNSIRDDLVLEIDRRKNGQPMMDANYLGTLLLQICKANYIEKEKGLSSNEESWEELGKMILEFKPVINGIASEDGKTILHYAAAFDSTAILLRLFQQGADPHVVDMNNKTPFDIAVRFWTGNVLMIRCLASKMSENKKLELPLMEACHYHKFDMINHFFNLIHNQSDKYEAFNEKDAGYSLLHLLKFLQNKSQKEILQYENLVDKFLTLQPLIVISDEYGPVNNALHYGVCTIKSIVKKLLDYGWNINAVNPDGKTPLQIAAKQSNTEIVELLLESHADYSSFCNKNGQPKEYLGLFPHEQQDFNFRAYNVIEKSIPGIQRRLATDMFIILLNVCDMDNDFLGKLIFSYLFNTQYMCEYILDKYDIKDIKNKNTMRDYKTYIKHQDQSTMLPRSFSFWNFCHPENNQREQNFIESQMSITKNP